MVGTIIGLFIGLIVGIIKTAPNSNHVFLKILQKIINVILSVYIEVFRGTPMIVQAMVIYYGYAYFTGISLNRISAAIFIVSINTGAYMAEIVRGGIVSIDKGQFEGAHAIGMSHWQTMVYIVTPQVIRNILPAVGNEFVINIKDTSVLNVISVTELYFQSTSISSINYQIFPTLTITCIIYFILTFGITRILRLIEKKLDGPKNYEILTEKEGA
ncbi:Glutamine transport system permease protein GlnP [bioreactor metagenome]|uniref:Glutamine transport system permease protein GlnP n=1 Tax=bioreactor metagenome TaxID=1076179 RepID=A0A645DKN3_9ZZZZ